MITNYTKNSFTDSMFRQESIVQSLLDFFDVFINTRIRIHPIYLFSFLVIAFILYKRYQHKNTHTTFFSWLFPKSIYFHPSQITDIKLFILGRILSLSSLFSGLGILILSTNFVINFANNLKGFTSSSSELNLSNTILLTILLACISDICVYWVHRIHHEFLPLWPFHATHHSAEVMTPITVYRKHPIYDLFSNSFKGLLIGLFQGLLLALFFANIEIYLVIGTNTVYFAFNIISANFRHSHIWFSYGPKLEHIFISPAQHQIHHSLEPKHHNKNYGEIFAIWDWIFGTLYIPESYEDLKYGISKSSSSNEAIQQPHPNLKEALIVPFKDSWKHLWKNSK